MIEEKIEEMKEEAAPVKRKPGRPKKTDSDASKATATKKASSKAASKATAKASAKDASADKPKSASKPKKAAARNPKKILFVGGEVMPFAATGGLGDVMGSLPAAIRAKYGEDADIRVVSPLYDTISDEIHRSMKTEAVFELKLAWRNQYCGILSLVKDGVTFYFVDNEYYFKRGAIYGHFDDGERFAYFSKAVIEMMAHLDYYPDILHANDWQAAMSVVYLNTGYRHIPEYANIKTVFTIHNIEYQGKYDFSILQDVFDISPQYYTMMEYDGCINLVKAAIVCADRVTTVSPTYANEILTPEYSHRLNFILANNSQKLGGILNGIDTKYYDPRIDKDIYVNYGLESLEGKKENKLAFQREFGLPEDPDAPIMAVITRLATHKGIDIIAEMLRNVLDDHPKAQFVVLGTGEGRYEQYFRLLEEDYPDRVRSFIMYNRALSKKIYAAADIFIMPSRSEPCGLSQMIASRYGAVPIVRETGGLYDSIKPYYEDENGMHGNGFTFANYSSVELADRVDAALRLYENKAKFEELVRRVMSVDFSWDVSAEKYMEMYLGM